MLEETYLGLCYERGDGVKKDFEKAVKWYKSGAYSGDAVAMWHMGLCYESGIGVEKSFTIAVEWYEKAAEKGCPMAQTRLGKCYESGMGTIKDNEKAVIMYQKAANQGDLEAQQRLGICYDLGVGVGQDKERALYWFSRAALETYRDEFNQGSSIAKKRIESYSDLGIHTLEYQEKKDWYELDIEAIGTIDPTYISYKRSIVPSECEDFDDVYLESVSEETESSQKRRLIGKERVMYIEKAVLGDKQAQYELAKVNQCANDEILNEYDLYNAEVDYEARIFFNEVSNVWLEKSLNQEDSNIDFAVGEYLYNKYRGSRKYVKEIKVEEKLIDSIKLLWRAAEKGNCKAQRLVATAYSEHMEDYNQEKIIEWLLPLAESGDVEAQYLLGDCIEKRSRNNFSMIHEEAVRWYRKAALQGHSGAQYKLGICYEYGEGVQGDLEKAFYWFYQAAKKNHFYAYYKVGNFYEHGKVVDVNPTEAIKYYEGISREEASITARYRLGCYYEHGNGVQKNIRKAMDWYAQSAYSGYFKACEAFIRCYENYDVNNIEDNKNDEGDLYCDFDWSYKDITFILGRYYEEGIGVEKSEKKAVELYEKAVEKGNNGAEYLLAKCYEFGIGVEKNERKAFDLYTELAERLSVYGDLWALYRLAKCYEEGKGVRQNKKQAKKKYLELKMIIEERYTSQIKTVEDINNQNCVEDLPYIDMAEAYEKFFNDTYYDRFLGCSSNTNFIPTLLSKVQNAIVRLESESNDSLNAEDSLNTDDSSITNEENTIEWQIKLAKEGNLQAQEELAIRYMNGDGVEQSEEITKYWYRRAQYSLVLRDYERRESMSSWGPKFITDIVIDEQFANEGNEIAQMRLGRFYLEGNDEINKDEEKGVEWLKKSAEQGNAEAQELLGNCYMQGTGVDKDEKTAAYWHEKAAEQGRTFSQSELVRCYEQGIGVEINDKIVVKWLEKLTDAESQFKLAFYYESGSGTYENELKAVEIYQRLVSENNHIGAKYKLALRLESGCGIKKDLTQAIDLYIEILETFNSCVVSKAAHWKYQDFLTLESKRWADGAKFRLDHISQCFEYGIGVEKNTQEANRLYGEVLYNTAMNLKIIDELENKAEKLFALYLNSAEYGHKGAIQQLAICYEKGLGVEKNEEKANAYYEILLEKREFQFTDNIASFYKRHDDKTMPESIAQLIQEEEDRRKKYKDEHPFDDFTFEAVSYDEFTSEELPF